MNCHRRLAIGPCGALRRRGGHACLVGFLGGGGPLALEPVFQIPSGVHLSVFASALVTGTPDFPLSEIPFQAIVDRVAGGAYKAKPAQVLRFDQIQAGHRLMEANGASGKIVVRVWLQHDQISLRGRSITGKMNNGSGTRGMCRVITG